MCLRNSKCCKRISRNELRIGKAPALFTPSSKMWLLKSFNLKIKLGSWTLKFCPSMWTWYRYARAIGRYVHVCQNSFRRKTKVLNRIPYSVFFSHGLSTTYLWHSPEKNGKVSGIWDEKKVMLTLGRSKGVEQAWSLFKFDSFQSAGVTVAGAEGPKELGRWSVTAHLLCREGRHLLIPCCFHGYSPAGNSVMFLSKA